MKATIKPLHTYLDLGIFSVLSLNKRSEISVSGLDLFPYLRKEKKKSIFLYVSILKMKNKHRTTRLFFFRKKMNRADIKTTF